MSGGGNSATPTRWEVRMDKLEKIIKDIMKQAEQDGEPVTYDEAKEMAEMELKSKDLTLYTTSEKPRKAVKKERKVDEEKKFLLEQFGGTLCTLQAEDVITKTETEISFTYCGNAYTLKLTKHRVK